MAAALLASVATVVEVEGSLAILANGCGRNSGTWTSSQSLRKTSTSSIPMLPEGLCKKLNNIEGPKQLRLKGEIAQILLQSSMRPVSHHM